MLLRLQPRCGGLPPIYGHKTAFICADAAQSVWDKAEKFLE